MGHGVHLRVLEWLSLKPVCRPLARGNLFVRDTRSQEMEAMASGSLLVGWAGVFGVDLVD